MTTTVPDENTKPTEAPGAKEAAARPSAPGKAPGRTFQAMMQVYYGHIFPSTLMHRWLSYGHGGKGAACDVTFFKRREFCFTLEGDIFARYKSFHSGRDLQAALKEKVPTKIDIGPVYTQDPARRAAYKGDTSASGFKPVQRELVFDIDLTDYDDVRNSSSGTGMSKKCWVLMHIAIQVLDHGLREDFGFEHILWVYSGRRGIHCWVCDERARLLTDEQRGAIANYFAVYKGQEKGAPRLALAAPTWNHPALEQAYDQLLAHWDKVLKEQQVLTTPRTRAVVLRFLPEGESEVAWESKLSKLAASADCDAEMNPALWNELSAQAQTANKKKAAAWKKSLQQIVFAFCYPRLDIEVSKKMNHLLKAPFCVHPKTGKVCVPIDPQNASDFDPDGVPTLRELVAHVDASNEASKAPSRLEEHLHFFQDVFLAPLEAAASHAVLQDARSREATSLAW